MAEREAFLEREKDPSRAALLLTIAALVTFAIALYLGVGWIDRGERVAGLPSELGARGPITSVGELTGEPAKANLVGRSVAVDAVVSDVVGDYVFWVRSPKGGESVPVTLMGERTARQDESVVEVEKGDRVRIHGTARELRAARRMDERWALDSAERERLNAAEVYVSATQVLGR